MVLAEAVSSANIIRDTPKTLRSGAASRWPLPWGHGQPQDDGAAAAGPR